MLLKTDMKRSPFLLQPPQVDQPFGIDYLPPSLTGGGDFFSSYAAAAAATAASMSPQMPSASSGTKRYAGYDSDARIDSIVAKRMKTATDLVNLEEYFYAKMDGDITVSERNDYLIRAYVES